MCCCWVSSAAGRPVAQHCCLGCSRSLRWRLSSPAFAPPVPAQISSHPPATPCGFEPTPAGAASLSYGSERGSAMRNGASSASVASSALSVLSRNNSGALTPGGISRQGSRLLDLRPWVLNFSSLRMGESRAGPPGDGAGRRPMGPPCVGPSWLPCGGKGRAAPAMDAAGPAKCSWPTSAPAYRACHPAFRLPLALHRCTQLRNAAPLRAGAQSASWARAASARSSWRRSTRRRWP